MQKRNILLFIGVLGLICLLLGIYVFVSVYQNRQNNSVLPTNQDNSDITITSPTSQTIYTTSERGEISWIGASAPYTVIYLTDTQGNELGTAATITDGSTSVSWNIGSIIRDGDIGDSVIQGRYKFHIVGYTESFCKGFCAPGSKDSSTELFNIWSDPFEITYSNSFRLNGNL